MAMLDRELDMTSHPRAPRRCSPNKLAEPSVFMFEEWRFRGCYVQPLPSFQPAQDRCLGRRLSSRRRWADCLRVSDKPWRSGRCWSFAINRSWSLRRFGLGSWRRWLTLARRSSEAAWIESQERSATDELRW